MRVVLFLLISFLATNSFASEIFFLNKSTTDALELATKLDKPFFVFYCGRWCPTCKVMEDHTFQDDNVAAFAAENFLAFKANVDEQNGKEWKEKYGVYVVPTIIFFDKYGNQKDLHASTLTAIAFLDIMERNAALSGSKFSADPIATVSNNVIRSTSQTIGRSSVIPEAQNAIPKPVSQPVPQAMQIATAQPIVQKITKQSNPASGYTSQDALLENAKNINAPIDEEITLQETLSTVGQIPQTELTNATQKKKKKRKRRKKKNQALAKMEFPKAADPTVTIPTDPNLDLKPIKSFQQSPAETTTQVISKTTAPEIKPEVVIAKPVRKKRKSIVLNPKKEVAPRNIVIRTERIQPTAPTPTSVPAAQTRVMSMVTAQPVSTPSAAPTTNYITGYLQLGYFESHNNASVLITKVRQQFYNNTINLKELKVDGKRVYRVTMNGFKSKTQLNQMKTQLKKAGFKSFIFEN